MKIEIRNQRPGDTWPSGEAWEVATPENLRALCADLTREEIAKVLQQAGPMSRAAHVVTDIIERVAKERGEDVLISRREVVKLRRMGKGREAPPSDPVAALRWMAPSLSLDDAKKIHEQQGLAGREYSDHSALAVVKAYFEAMGSVEFVTVDDPGPVAA